MEFSLLRELKPVFSLRETELFAWAVGGAERQTASNKSAVFGRLCKHSLPLSIPKGYYMYCLQRPMVEDLRR